MPSTARSRSCPVARDRSSHWPSTRNGPSSIPTTGQARGRPIDFGFKPLDAPRYADLDGDGAPEVLALEAGKPFAVLGRVQASSNPTLVAFSSATGRRLWGEILWTDFQPQRKVPSSAWPLVADFDGDGRDELVVPHLDTLPASLQPSTGGSVYQRFANARQCHRPGLWAHAMGPTLRGGWTKGADALPGLLGGPDLDGDGTRDLVTVSRYDGHSPGTYSTGQPLDRDRVYVDAISGQDGHRLWWWYEDVTDYTAPRIGPPLWWGRGPDGWPMLVVPLGGKAPGEIELPYQQAGRMPPVVRILEASTGRKLHTIDGLSWPKLADLDGDGLEDLWGSVEGKLRAFRGGPPEAWRSLDELVPVADLDGDRLADALAVELHSAAGFEKDKMDSRTAVARSGRDGRVLWTRKLDDGEGSLNWETWFGARPRHRLDPLDLPAPPW